MSHCFHLICILFGSIFTNAVYFTLQLIFVESDDWVNIHPFFLDYLFNLTFCCPFPIVITFLIISLLFLYVLLHRLFFPHGMIQFGSQWVSLIFFFFVKAHFHLNYYFYECILLFSSFQSRIKGWIPFSGFWLLCTYIILTAYHNIAIPKDILKYM